jgi:hypothetical protein
LLKDYKLAYYLSMRKDYNPERIPINQDESKGFTPILVILGIVLILGIAGGVYYFGKSRSPNIADQPQIVASPTQKSASETQDWKTYTNSKLKFSFQYPSDHTAYNDIDQKKPALIPADSDSNKIYIASNEEMVFCCEPSTLSFSIEESDQAPRQKAEEYLAGWETEKPIIKDSMFAGLPAVEASGRGGYGPPHKLIITSRMNSLLIIRQNADDQFFDQILSTFKFLDSINGIGLQICPDEWYEDDSPCLPTKSSSECNKSEDKRQYFILNGQRRELTEFDMDWVKNNCSIQPQIVQ